MESLTSVRKKSAVFFGTILAPSICERKHVITAVTVWFYSLWFHHTSYWNLQWEQVNAAYARQLVADINHQTLTRQTWPMADSHIYCITLQQLRLSKFLYPHTMFQFHPMCTF
jgi:hypothetical protein